MSAEKKTDELASLGAGNLFGVSGIVAVITGGGSGIGLMMAKALAANGASKVYILGRRLEVLQSAATSVGPNVVPLACDVTSKSSLQSAAAAIEQEAGFVNLLVCNAGVGGPQVKAPSGETTAAEWAQQHLEHDTADYTRVFDVNVTSVWYTAMSFVKLLDLGNKQGNVSQSSQVVSTSSIAAFNKVAPGGWAYGQSKAAATLLLKHLSSNLPRWNIRANCIAPGLFPSEMSAPILKLYSDDGSVPKEMVPIQRLGDTQDMAGAILYLASRAGAYCNGAVITVDGGRLGNFPTTWHA
ncbi:Short-chain dehydrogenase/reductase SAT3 [Colletotrichum orbiculare MAFF 240422]|uniref:Short-chain dehydrogenase/reductase SAT3 n=1 Tax=Colletotrichum orbiculare (strain 104-T / ATCC 96160 / CBS 514.97 / LARS 414 / MAFF 240422) TaxID=1213857 RepID=N4V9M1_COLOR|nr:Short-chain dehydrogenase/reductase SAT3 [Colletotrichum orbiculare MAFF 240422]